MEKSMTPKETVLVISDTQAPAQHPDTLKFLDALKRKYRPTKVVHIGDSLDCRNYSTHPPMPDLAGPSEEIDQGLQFLSDLYTLLPNGVECVSNHNIRPYLRAQEAGLPTRFLRPYEEWMGMPKGWKMVEKIIIDGVLYFHGEGLSGDGARLKATTLLQRSAVFGHLHANAGISWFGSHEKLTFGFNVGCLIDLRSPYFKYNAHDLKRPIVGTGLVIKGLPVFHPMTLDKNSRWVGKL